MTIVGHFDFNRTAKIESLEKRSLEMAPRLLDGKDFDPETFHLFSTALMGRDGGGKVRALE